MPWFTFGNGVWLPKFEFCRPLWKWKFSLFVTDFTVMQIFKFWLHFRIRGCFCVEPSQKRTSKFVFCSCKIYKALALSKPPQLSQSMMVPNFVTKGPALALLWELAHLDDFNKWAYSIVVQYWLEFFGYWLEISKYLDTLVLSWDWVWILSFWVLVLRLRLNFESCSIGIDIGI